MNEHSVSFITDWLIKSLVYCNQRYLTSCYVLVGVNYKHGHDTPSYIIVYGMLVWSIVTNTFNNTRLNGTTLLTKTCFSCVLVIILLMTAMTLNILGQYLC